MNAELKAKWIEALRSGKYTQGRDQLRYGVRFCCLGVVCDLVMPNAWSLNRLIDNGCRYDFMPPPSIGVPDDLQDELASMNDIDRKSFAEIADYIERNVEAA